MVASGWYVTKFIYLDSNISSTESDVSLRLVKAWNVIDMWKSYQSDKTKRDFFQAVAVSMLQNGCTTWTHGEKARKKLHENAACCLEEILEAISHKTVVRPPASFFTNHTSKTIKTKQLMADQQRLTSSICGHKMQTRRSARNDGWSGWMVRKVRELHVVCVTWWRWKYNLSLFNNYKRLEERCSWYRKSSCLSSWNHIRYSTLWPNHLAG